MIAHRLFIVYEGKSARITDNRWHRWDAENRCPTAAIDNKREPSKTSGCKSSQCAWFGEQTATGPGSSAYTSRTELLTKSDEKERRPKREPPGYQSRMMAR